MKSYSVELRGEVLAACDADEGTRVIAVRFEVSESWVRRIKQQRRETGLVAPKTAARRPPKWQAWADWLVVKITARPNSYLRELQAELKQERGEEVVYPRTPHGIEEPRLLLDCMNRNLEWFDRYLGGSPQ